MLTYQYIAQSKVDATHTASGPVQRQEGATYSNKNGGSVEVL